MERPWPPGRRLPFHELLEPSLHRAQEELSARASSLLELLSEDAREELSYPLLLDLSDVSACALYAEFSAFRTASLSLEPRGAAPNAYRASEAGTKIYDAFVAQSLDDECRTILRRYRALDELFGRLTSSWISASEEFLRRLNADAAKLDAAFQDGAGGLGPVDSLKAGMSDRHGGGRSVSCLRFSSGVRIVYKPRSVAPEEDFFDLLKWINKQRALRPFKTLKVVSRAAYGWVEYVPGEGCNDAREVERYYERFGMLLGLVYILGGRDFHAANVIAAGEEPVLIDLEALLHPRLSTSTAAWLSAHAGLNHAMGREDSVLLTGLLPYEQALDTQAPEYAVDGAGGLESARGQRKARRWLTWKNANTDAMSLSVATRSPSVVENLPLLDGRRIGPSDFGSDIERGFIQMYRFLCDHRSALLGKDGPIRALANTEVRVVLRDTRTYQIAIERSLRPSCLTSTAARKASLRRLWGRSSGSASENRLERLLDCERVCMEALDIPRLAARTTSKALLLPSGERIDDVFQTTGFGAATDRLEEASEGKLRSQVQIIRKSLRS